MQLARGLWVAAGFLCLAIGLVGIVLPIMPTVPFLLLASACFVRGSERMHQWLLNHGRLGAMIRDYEEGRGVPKRAKVIGITMLWVSILVSTYNISAIWLRIVMITIAIGVTAYLLHLPTVRKARP